MLGRIAPAILVSALLATGLSACAQHDHTTPTAAACKSYMGAGPLSDGVQVRGEFGAEPQLEIPGKMQIASSQRTIIANSRDRAGDYFATGARATENSWAAINFAIYDQADGKELLRSQGFAGSGKAELIPVSQLSANPISESLRCTIAGERVVLAIAPQDAAPLRANLGGNPETSLVVLIDVVAISPQQIKGKAQGLPEGFPGVTTDENGRPGMVLPPVDAPPGSHSAVRIAGAGPLVTKDSNVVTQILAVSWQGEVLQNSWQAQPGAMLSPEQEKYGTVQMLGDEQSALAQGFGFRQQLTGQRVGSQMVIVEGGENARAIVVNIIAADK